VLYAFVALGLV